MAADPTLIPPRAPLHATMRVSVDQSSSTGTAAADPGNPAVEYSIVCEFIRLHATLRFYRLFLLLGTTGSIVTALLSVAARTNVVASGFFKAGGLLIALAFLVMDFRAASEWHRLLARANQLAQTLQYQPFPVSSRWHPLTTTGAGFILHALVTVLWLASLFIAPPSTP